MKISFQKEEHMMKFRPKDKWFRHTETVLVGGPIEMDMYANPTERMGGSGVEEVRKKVAGLEELFEGMPVRFSSRRALHPSVRSLTK